MEFPAQEASGSRGKRPASGGEFDMRDWLTPRRLTTVMWDHTFLTRHVPGESFDDYDRALDEAMERGYNTLRLDPMPQVIDLARPEIVYKQPKSGAPYLPWTNPDGFEGPAGAWLIEFMEKVLDRRLNYVLSAWWGSNIIPSLSAPHTIEEGARAWIRMLEEWGKRFGFDGCVYVDLNNEFPYFLSGQSDHFEEKGGARWSPDWRRVVGEETNAALAGMREAFPELRFMVSIHGDTRWMDVELELDCMDVHFYADADPRWSARTKFGSFASQFFKETSWHKEFSQRCSKARDAAAAMYRARQRAKVAAFAGWAEERGMPLTTSESWSSWYYIDSPDLDWSWLLEWAEWSVEDAIDFQMWGWTPHNYCQPQFANWQDVSWHRRLTERFLRS